MINLIKNIRRRILLAEFSNWTLVSIVMLVVLSACKPKTTVLKSPPGYNFQAYDSKKLSLKLREISGIDWDRKRNVFVAEEDEGGNIYILDKNKNITAAYQFGPDEDYEDIAMVDSVAYILRSDGMIFSCMVDPVRKTNGVELSKLELPGNNEFETLFYDEDRKALIMICKDCESDKDDKISAYAYYIDSSGFDPKPVFQIDRSAIAKLAPQKASEFQPSAAAIQPRQQKLYILSAVSNQLAITDLNGKVEGVYVLTSKMFPQAEGICFQKDGTMYISNEGGNGRASILSFNYSESNSVEEPKQEGVYDLSKPDDKMVLRKHLHEISGMAWIPGKDLILAENDEKGDIYQVDFKNKKDDFKKIKFGGHGDYEDIVHTDNADYLLVSSGTIVQVMMGDSSVTGTKEYELDKKGKNEFETLYADPADNSLVMLCKQCSHEKEDSRSAFRFDLNTHKFSDEPLYTMDIAAIRKMLNDDGADFKPSAAAINPITGKLFIVASVGKLLVVTDKKGNVEQVFRLDPKLFNQPEGITFAPNGDLYVSNEGGEGDATILKFNYKK